MFFEMYIVLRFFSPLFQYFRMELLYAEKVYVNPFNLFIGSGV